MESPGGVLMIYPPSWLPQLEKYNDYGSWEVYVDALYEIYLDDFIKNPIFINGKKIQQRREPKEFGKDKAFWHICGHDYIQDTPETFSRFERIRWPKAIILNRHDTTIKIWQEDNNYGSTGTYRISIWFNDEYLVVLEPRESYILFITAFCTDRSHKRKALQKKFEKNYSGGLVL